MPVIDVRDLPCQNFGPRIANNVLVGACLSWSKALCLALGAEMRRNPSAAFPAQNPFDPFHNFGKTMRLGIGAPNTSSFLFYALLLLIGYLLGSLRADSGNGGLVVEVQLHRAKEQDSATTASLTNPQSSAEYLQPNFTLHSICSSRPYWRQWLTLASKTHAILNPEQRTWIATTIATNANAPYDNNVLIFGCGKDTAIWFAANCRARGMSRTLVLENDVGWRSHVLAQFPDLAPSIELFNGYRSTLETANEYFKNPDPEGFHSRLPSSVSSVCWDVILVDAPMGFNPEHPGRHEAISWVAHHVIRCFKENRQERDVFVFVHDAQREVEKQAVETFLIAGAAGQEMGRLLAKLGDLVGFVFTREDTLKAAAMAASGDKVVMQNTEE